MELMDAGDLGSGHVDQVVELSVPEGELRAVPVGSTGRVAPPRPEELQWRVVVGRVRWVTHSRQEVVLSLGLWGDREDVRLRVPPGFPVVVFPDWRAASVARRMLLSLWMGVEISDGVKE